MNAQVNELSDFSGSFRNGYRPIWDKKDQAFATNESGYVKIANSQGLVKNSLLRKDEWEALDAAIIEAARSRLNAIQRLQDLGLVKPLESIGILSSQWNVGSEMTRATVNLSGQSTNDRDLQDYKLKGVPVPVVHKGFRIGERTLQASRRLGEGIDVTNGYEASRVVAEELERLFFDGNDDVELNGDNIFGVTNHGDINTGTAASYGGGDFGTISNILPTFLGALGDLHDAHMFGPFEAWIYSTQYTQMMDVYTDGSGQSALNRVLGAVPNLNAIHPSDYLAAGEMVLVQMTPNVIDLALHELNMVVEWSSGDGMTHDFKVMSIAVPRVKSDYDGNSGICYVTSC